MARKTVKPGQAAPVSGQYRPTGGSPYEVTAVKGKPMPPTPTAGQSWVAVDKTKHKSGQ